MMTYEEQQKLFEEKAAKKQKQRDTDKAVYHSLKKAHKLCTCCGKELSLLNFHVDRKSMTGYSSVCKQCKRSSQEGKAKD